jgi:plasmid rolling circle replication initiator protein Rep
MWRARFLEAVPRLKDDYPTARYLFLTLTVRNCEIEQLRDTLSWMNKAWLRLTKRKEFQALGWVKSVEVTRNSNDNSAHPHLHVLLMVRSNYFSTGYISQARWRSLWQECLRADYLPVVNIKTIKNRPSKAPSIPGSDTIEYSDGLLYGILETLKYGVKVPDLVADQHWLLELTRQTHKTRSVAIGGVLRGYLREHDPEDLLTEDESIDSLVEDAPLLYFDWFTQIRRYVKVDPRLS